MQKKTEYDGRLCLIGICRDITERVDMEKRIRDAERMAYIGHITTSLSHEIRNPLSSIKMNLQIIKNRLNLDPLNSRRVEISIKEIKHLENILNELLDFAKPINIIKSKVYLDELISTCIEFLEPKLRRKNIEVVKKGFEGLPYVMADKNKLKQVFINLILNVFDSSKEGDEIFILGNLKKSNVEVYVVDKGNVVPEEIKEKIFEPFFTTKSSGTGLGLSNAKKIVEAHGGKLTYESKLEGYFDTNCNIFKVSLPIV